MSTTSYSGSVRNEPPHVIRSGRAGPWDRRLPRPLHRALGPALPALLALVLMAHAAGSAPERWAAADGTGQAGDLTAPPDAVERTLPPVGIGRIFDGAITDSLYLVGPGDRFLLHVAGVNPLRHLLEVDLEGRLILPELGSIEAAGHTLAQTREMAMELLRAAFPRSSITFSLAAAREFRVFLAGAIEHPGSYRASAADRVSDLILAGGKLPESASRRNLQVTHRDGTVQRADLDRFLQTGDLSRNPRLSDGDVVMVPFLGARGELHGGVYRPGTWEWVEGERFSDILNLAGGFATAALRDSIRLVRFPGTGVESVTSFFSYPQSDPELRPRDQIFVRLDMEWRLGPTVNVTGEVRYPMILPISETETRVADAIRTAGGLTELAAVGEATLLRSGSVERMQDLEFERLKKIAVADMSKEEYAYFKMKSRERAGRMQVDFAAVLADPRHPDNILLRDGDVIQVPRTRHFVQVSGQVADPGNVLYEPELTVQDYVARAGGYAWNARKSRTTLIRARSGEWVRNPDRDTRLEPGDVLWVPEKSDYSFWAILRDGMLVASQAATVVLLAREVTR